MYACYEAKSSPEFRMVAPCPKLNAPCERDVTAEKVSVRIGTR
jgi:hypothetical protein